MTKAWVGAKDAMGGGHPTRSRSCDSRVTWEGNQLGGGGSEGCHWLSLAHRRGQASGQQQDVPGASGESEKHMG